MRKLITTCLSMCLAWTVQAQFNPQKEIDYCANQALKTIQSLPKDGQGKNIPRSIDKDKTDWRYVDYKDWCSGFWSGCGICMRAPKILSLKSKRKDLTSN